jgi:hypothetical protein
MALTVTVVKGADSYAVFSFGPVKFNVDTEVSDYALAAEACRDESSAWHDETFRIQIRDGFVEFEVEAGPSFMSLKVPASDCVDAFEKAFKELSEV